MTGPTDPALRALLTNRQVPDTNSITITVGELRALAAAEAAPPSRQRCVNCGETDYIVDAAAEAAPLDVLFAPYFEAHPNAADDEDNEWCMKHLPRIAQVRVALRSPDTETCPDCGLTAERIGQMHITAQRLRSPDTETAGEAG
jgi:hypothetical protein